jgi:ATP-dependent DNA helicase RecQ
MKKNQSIQQIVKSKLGYEELRPGQEAAIRSVLDHRDTLAVMPTGSGKSAIYQLTAAQLPGSTLVISPLLALQQDQVESIAEEKVGKAAVINSTLTVSQRAEIFEQWQSGDLEFLFLAPEQFSNPETLERLKTQKLSLFVVDEAHCISEWGHDFRPDYLHLGCVIEALGHPTILALTATASPPVREEIVRQLRMKKPNIIVRGFDRPNLYLSVDRFEEDREKQEIFVKTIQHLQKPGIVYAATRKMVERLTQLLQEQGVNAIAYHAGLKSKDREQIQSSFMQDESDVIVATTAFGMGVDKPNVRFVLHYNISDSIDAYYQEIGRAGRDGDPAKAILLYSSDDLNIRKFFSGSAKLDPQEIIQVAEIVQRQKQPLDPKDLKNLTEFSSGKLKTMLNHLSSLSVIEILPTGAAIGGKSSLDSEDAAAEVITAQDRKVKVERSRLEMMRGYAEVRDCRRQYLLNYFGEQLEERCGHCDNCKAGITIEDDDKTPKPYAINSRVAHRAWGEGLVMRYEGDKIIILFDQMGYRTLSITTAMLRGLLSRI